MSKKILVILITLLILGAAGGALGYFLVYNKPHRNIERASVDYQLSAEELFAALEADKEGADKKYLADDVMQVRGVVMDKISLGDTVLVLNVSTSVQADNLINVQLHSKYVNESDYHSAYEALSEGDPVTVKGKYTGSDLEDLIIIQAYKVSLNNGFIIQESS